MNNACFHCHEPITDTDSPSFNYSNQRLSFCCYGCASICEEIIRLGNFNYYEKRTSISIRPDEALFDNQSIKNEAVKWLNSPELKESDDPKVDPLFSADFNSRYFDNIKVYDDEVLLEKYVTVLDVDENSIGKNSQNTNTHNVSPETEKYYQCHFDVYDMTCSACAWLIEKSLSKDDAIKKMSLNYSSESLELTWLASQYSVSDIIYRLQRLGYKIIPHQKEASNRFQVTQKKLLKRLGITALFTMQIMTLSVALYAGDYQGMDLSFQILMQKTSMILSLPIMIFGAQPFLLSAWRSLKNRHLNMDVPISIALILAFCTSVVHTIKNSAINDNLANLTEAPVLSDVYFDSISMLIFFLLLSRFFEAKAKRLSNDRIRKLAEIIPLYANRYVNVKQQEHQTQADVIQAIDNAKIEKVASERLVIGDIILLKRGETLAADGRLLSSSNSFNQSVVTGESNHIDYQMNDTIVAGSINVGNDAIIECLQVGEETSLHKINRLAKNSQQQRTSISQYVDTIARYFTIGLLCIAAASAYYWYLHEPSRWIEITLAILVVTCPCALSLATPVSVATAISALLEKGILLKDIGALKTLSKINRIIFDKTGTLTQGKLSLRQLINVSASIARPTSKSASSALSTTSDKAFSDDELLALLAGLEKNASHAIATAIQEKAKHLKPIALDVNQKYHGVMAKYNGIDYFFGNRQFIVENTAIDATAIDALLQNARTQQSDHNTQANSEAEDDTTNFVPGNVSILANHQTIIAICLFSDMLKEDSFSLIQSLQAKQYQITLLSGDNPITVAEVAKQLNIHNHKSEQSPADKLQHIKALQAQGDTVLMVGDGVNDAPVLAASDASIAVKDATNYAIAESDLVLINTHMNRVISALDVSKKTNRVIKQNLSWSLMYNIMTVPAAVMGYVHPLVAAIGMSLSSLLVVLNALRILKK